jgi:hypothetical protein
MKHLILFLALVVTACAQVICPKCQEARTTSIVTELHTTSTLAYRPVQYSASGERIDSADTNSWTTYYSCSAGHTFTSHDIVKPSSGLYVSALRLDEVAATSGVYIDNLVINMRSSPQLVLALSGIKYDESNYPRRPEKPEEVKVEIFTTDGRRWVAKWELQEETK